MDHDQRFKNLIKTFFREFLLLFFATWAERLMCVRVFARYCSGADPRTEVPPVGILPFRPQRATPSFTARRKFGG